MLLRFNYYGGLLGRGSYLFVDEDFKIMYNLDTSIIIYILSRRVSLQACFVPCDISICVC